MAQAGFTPISLYYSTTSTQEPAAADLVSGELAINIADGKLFYKNSGGNVRLLSIGYGSSTVTPTNGGVQYGTGTALALTAAGSSGQILRSNGAAAPSWADLSTLGVNTISFGTTGLTPNSATAGAVTVAGTLVTANGGTGLGGATPFTANGVLYASSASALTSGSALTFDGVNLSTNTGGTNATLGINSTSSSIYLQSRPDISYSRLISSVYQLDLTTVANQPISFGTNNTLRMTLDGSGNLGLGVTPSAWNTAARCLDVLTYGGFFSENGYYGRTGVANNAYLQASTADTYIYKVNSSAQLYDQKASTGEHRWFTAPSGTAGNAITFTQALTLDASGNLLLGGTSAGASSAASLAIFNGTAPTGSVTNGIILYAEDVSSSSELKVRDEAGNVTTLSPHNFSLIPEGPSEDMAWAYYSEKGSKRINVDMLKLARMVEKLTGEKLVYES